MRWYVGAALNLLVACSGDSTDEFTEAACDGLVTTPLGTVPAEEWAPGIVTVKDDVEALEGFYSAIDSCAVPPATGKYKKPTIGITTIAQKDLQLVTTPYPAGSPCGCAQDTDFGPDSSLDMTAFVPDFSIVVSEFDDPFIPGFIFETTGATYAPGEPLLIRACATATVDPGFASQYSSVDALLRVSQDLVPELELVLDPIDGSEPVSCSFTDLKRLK